MARLRNSVFVGSSAYEVDIDQLTFTRVLKNAIADTNLVDDILTGDNSPPTDTLIDHRGDGRGCPLGAPLVNLLFARAPGEEPVSAFADATTAYLFVVPFYLPRGETDVVVSIGTDATIEGAAAHFFDDTWTEVATAGLTFFAGEEQQRAGVALDGGQMYILAVETRDVAGIGGPNISSLFVGFTRINRQGLLVAPVYNPGEDVRVPTFGVARLMTSLDENQVGDGRAISSFQLTRLAANQNALEEFLTGAPAAGNSALTLVESGSTQPSTSSFHDHSRSVDKLLEGQVDFPVGAWSFGGIGVNGTDVGFGVWAAPEWLENVDEDTTTFAELPVQLPHFPEVSSGDSRLVVVVIANWRAEWESFRCQVDVLTAAGSSAGATSYVPFAQLGTSGFGIALLEDIDFFPDRYNTLVLNFDVEGGPSTAGGLGLTVLGACAYFVGG